MVISVETFFLKPGAQGTLQSQIQEMIAQGILSGRFHRGEKLPSSRKLAAHLKVSRITVTLAFTELVANDYLVSRGRSGYFVSENAPVPPSYEPVETRSDQIDWSRLLRCDFTAGDTPKKPDNWHLYKYPFIYGQADVTLFDHANWRLCAIRALGQKDFPTLSSDFYDRDDPMLLEFIARHTLPRRGISARPSEILITMGAQNALWLAAQVLARPDKPVAIEDPCYHALRDLLGHVGANVRPIRVDSDGLPPDAIPDDTHLVFTTPSHQSPTTATMPLDRRRALLDRAEEIDALIVEDDYEFEMSFLAPPSPALKSLDQDGRVIYVGSFSKSLFPGLRLGYLVGSEPFIRQARALRASILRHPPGHIQRTAAYFLSLGHYDAQIRRVSQTLHQRRSALETAVKDTGLTIAGGGVFGGSSLWMQADPSINTQEVARTLAHNSVFIEPGAPFFHGTHKPQNYYRLGYSSIPAERIPDGISLIADAMTNGKT